MKPWKFAVYSLLIYCLLGPLFSAFILVPWRGSFEEPISSISFWLFLYAPAAYVFGSKAALFCGVLFVCEILLVLPFFKKRQLLAQYHYAALGTIAGFLVAIPLGLMLTRNSWINTFVFFFIPSSTCGFLIGILLLEKLMIDG